MNYDYIIRVMTKSSECAIYERPRSRKALKNHKCSSKKISSLTAMSSGVVTAAPIHDTNHVNEKYNECEDLLDLEHKTQKMVPSLSLRNNNNINNNKNDKIITRNSIQSLKAEENLFKCLCDFSLLHFKFSNFNKILTYCLSVSIRIWVWLLSWLSWNTSNEWRLQKHTHTPKPILHIFYIHCILMLICQTVTISVAHETTQQALNSNSAPASAVTSFQVLQNELQHNDVTSTVSTELVDDLYSTSLVFPATSDLFVNQFANLLSRDGILTRQHQQQKVPSLTVNSSPAIPPPSSACSTCHARAKAKLDSLETIKMHILSQLRVNRTMEELSKPRQVPQNILDKYNREYDSNGQKRDYKKKSNQKSQNNLNKHSNVYNKHSSSSSSSSSTIEKAEIKAQKNDFDEKMQSDDPVAYSNEHYDDEDEEQLYSHINSIYVFPVSNRLRHNRKSEFLSFKFETNEETTITGAILHLYIRGHDWMKEFRPEVIQQIPTNDTAPELFFNVHRALKRTNSFNFTHTIQMTQVHQPIPSGLGKWIQIELPDLPKLWRDKVQDANFVIVVKTKDDWMRHFVETGRSDINGADSALTAHIEVRTQLGLGRHKRSASLDCQESDNELRCCRYPLKVNFTSFGWTFVVAPTDFDAYFCNGECKLGFLSEHPHTHLAALTRSASPCCSPKKMSSLTLLYFNLEQNLVLSTIPNMTVEKCSCS